MGIEEVVEPDSCEIQFFQGDIVVISSDGLTDKASPEEILELVINHRSDMACRKLVDLANSRGGEDNITAIVLKIKSGTRNYRYITGWLKKLFQNLFAKLKKPNLHVKQLCAILNF